MHQLSCNPTTLALTKSTTNFLFVVSTNVKSSNQIFHNKLVFYYLMSCRQFHVTRG